MGDSSLPVQKLSAIISALFLASYVLTPPASGYEVSVYDGLSTFTIVLGALTILIGIILVAVSLVYNAEYYWTGFGTIAIGYIGIYLIPIVRGYEIHTSFGTDLLRHAGLIQDILETGEIFDIRYPGTHILTASVSQTTDLSIETLSLIIPLLFFFCTVLFTGTFVWSLTGKTKLTLLVVLATIPLVIGPHRVLPQPWLLGMTFAPFLLILFHKFSHGKVYTGIVIASIIFVAQTIYHPLSIANSLVILVGYLFAVKFKTLSYQAALHHIKGARGFVIVSIGAIILSFWVLFVAVPQRHIGGLVYRVLGMSPGGGQHAEQAATDEFTIGQIFWHFFLPDLGTAALVFLLAGVMFLVIVSKPLRGNNLSMFDIISVALFLVSFIHGFLHILIQIYGTNILRNTQLLVFTSPFIIAAGLYELGQISSINFKYKRPLGLVILIFLISLPAFLGAATVYTEGNHLSTATVEGHGWLIDNKGGELSITSDSGRDMFSYYHYGFEEAYEIRRSDRIVTSLEQTPDRLGYNTNDTIAESVNNTYLLTRSFDLEQYREKPEWRLEQIEYYVESDIDRLKNDKTANHVYSNSEYSVWKVNSATTSTV